MSLPINAFTGFGATACTTAVISATRAKTGRVQAFRARVGVGLEAANGFGEVGPSHEKALGSSREQNAGTGLVEGLARRLYSFDRQG